VIIFLRALFILVLTSMLAVTTWASLHTPLTKIPPEVFRHPWFIATLFDAYWAFITFFIWVAWKESSPLAKILWFISILALGNIAMAVYMLREVFAVPAGAPLAAVFTSRMTRSALLPAILAAIGVIVYLLA
jgi:hypothetical protein